MRPIRNYFIIFARIEEIIQMNLEILNILDKADIKHERIVLKANDDCNAWPYILFRNNGKRNESKPFIFPNMEIGKGDMVTIYTKNGDSEKRKLGNGVTSHVLYWGENGSIWNADNCIALLVKIEDFKYKPV